MEKKIFVQDNTKENNYQVYQPISNRADILCANDEMVNDFLNKNVSLETLIEKQIFK